MSARKQAAAAKKLIRSNAPEDIAQGAELICDLEDGEVADRLLKGVATSAKRPPPDPGAAWFSYARAEKLAPNATFRGSKEVGAHRLRALLGVIGAAPGDAAEALRQTPRLALEGHPAAPLDLRALSRWTGLVQLALTGPAAGLEALAELPNLRHLSLAIPGLDDLSGLAGAQALETLYVRSEAEVSLAGLADLPALRQIAIEGGGVREPAALSALPALERAALPARVAVDDAPAVARIPSLSTSDLVGRIRRIAAGRAAQSPATGLPAGANADAALFNAAMARVDTAKIGQNFPRMPDGSLSTTGRGGFALLAQVGPGSEGDLWLGAHAHREEIALQIYDLKTPEYRHRWDLTPWRWAADAEPPGWHAEVQALLRGNAITDRAALQSRCDAGDASRVERIALSTLLLDAGQIDAACDLFGIDVDIESDSDWRVGGDRGRERLAWYLSRCAPWAIADAMAAGRAEHSAKRFRVWRYLAVLRFGGRSRPTLMCQWSSPDPRPRLIAAPSHHLEREAAARWLRPIAWDVERFG